MRSLKTFIIKGLSEIVKFDQGLIRTKFDQRVICSHVQGFV